MTSDLVRSDLALMLLVVSFLSCGKVFEVKLVEQQRVQGQRSEVTKEQLPAVNQRHHMIQSSGRQAAVHRQTE